MKRVINTLGLVRLRNELHVQFHETVISLIIALGAINFPFEALFALYKLAFDHESEALLIISKSEKTAEIVEQDRVRDNIFRGLSDTVKGHINHFETDMRVAANRLWNGIFTHFGNVASKSYDAETAAIKDLLRELKRPEMVTAINKLNLQLWVNKLEQENNKFHALMMERYCEATDKTTFRMKTTRVETDRYYRAIVATVENEVLLGNVPDTMKHFITELNAIVHRYKSQLTAHQHNSKKTEDNG